MIITVGGKTGAPNKEHVGQVTVKMSRREVRDLYWALGFLKDVDPETPAMFEANGYEDTPIGPDPNCLLIFELEDE